MKTICRQNVNLVFGPSVVLMVLYLAFADDILSSMENGQLSETVFLDLSKAFDTVNHKILLSKLSALGVCCDDLS